MSIRGAVYENKGGFLVFILYGVLICYGMSALADDEFNPEEAFKDCYSYDDRRVETNCKITMQ